jgi:hypothetical protein
MIVVLLTVGALMIASIVATVRAIAMDGYRRVPIRPVE